MTDWQRDNDKSAAQAGQDAGAFGAVPPPPPPPAQWPAAQGPWAPPQQPTQWPAAQGAYATSAPMSAGRRALIGIGAVVGIVALVAVVGMVVRSNDVTATSELKADSGTLLYSDDFTDRSWWVGTLDDGSTFAYVPSGFAITGRSDSSLSAEPSKRFGRKQLSISTTARQINSGPDTGFGVWCYRGPPENVISYEFVVLTDGIWYIQSRQGPYDEDVRPVLLASGIDAAPAGATPTTVVGICAEIDDDTTRIAMFVDGKKVADRLDTPEALPPGSWLGGIVVSAVEDGPTVTFTRFEVRDLSD